MNSKTAFRDTFRLMNGERPVFIPFIYGLAAKIGQIPLQDMVSDASYYAHSLEEAYELFKYDGIVNSYDTTIEAESFGCAVEWSEDYSAPSITDCNRLELREVSPEESYRSQVLLEATKRTVMSKGKDVAVIGTLTGPVSLVKTLLGDNNQNIENAISLAGNLLMKLVKSLGELRVDSVFFREDLLGTSYYDELLSHQRSYTDVYTTLFNLIKHYNSPPVLIVKNMKMDIITDLCQIVSLSGVVLLGMRFSEDDLAYLQKLSDSHKISFGLPLQLNEPSELWKQFDIINQYLSKNKPTAFFYVSDGEVPYDIPLEVLHDLMSKIQNP